MKQVFATCSLVALLSMSTAVAQEDPEGALPEETLAPSEEPEAFGDEEVPSPDESAPAAGAAPGALDRRLNEVRPYLGGLTGYGRVITSDVLSGTLDDELALGVRANFLVQHQRRDYDISFPGGTLRNEVRAQLYVFQAAVGLLDMVEVALSVPIIDYERSSNLGPSDQDAGFGNPEISAKFRVPLELDLISAAAYTRFELPWGERGVFEPERFPFEEGEFVEWELGAIVGVHAGIVSGTLNLGYRLIETGIQSFRYRFGVAVQPVEAFELGIYYDGEEYEGSVDSDGVFGATATAFFEPVFFQLGVDGLIVDGGSDERFTRTGGDGGGWSVYGSVGAAF